MQIWWELHEKYEEDLVKLEVFEGDDEDMLDKAGVESPKKQKKSGGKKSKVNRFFFNQFLMTVFLTFYRKQKREEKTTRRARQKRRPLNRAGSTTPNHSWFDTFIAFLFRLN